MNLGYGIDFNSVKDIKEMVLIQSRGSADWVWIKNHRLFGENLAILKGKQLISLDDGTVWFKGYMEQGEGEKNGACFIQSIQEQCGSADEEPEFSNSNGQLTAGIESTLDSCLGLTINSIIGSELNSIAQINPTTGNIDLTVGTELTASYKPPVRLDASNLVIKLTGKATSIVKGGEIGVVYLTMLKKKLHPTHEVMEDIRYVLRAEYQVGPEIENKITF
jgi:hypothetical protein